MSGLILFWTIICIVGLVTFYLLVLAIIPLAARDLLRLFKALKKKNATPKN